MEENDLRDLESLFAQVQDPRMERTRRHRLRESIMLAICGADGWVEIEEFGKAREAFFIELLGLPNGIPSHETFGRVFALLDPKQFEASFVPWVQGISKTVKGVIAIDGKTLRRSQDQEVGKKALHLVSAWAVENRLVLAQLATEEKSNEMTAIPVLLKHLALKGCMVTIDAMGTQTKLAGQIIDQEGEDALALKDKQGNLDDEGKATVALAEKDGFPSQYWEPSRQVENGHGRLEIREHWTRSRKGKACEALGWFALSGAWSRRRRKTRAPSCSVSLRSPPLPLRSEATGAVKTACSGFSMSPFAKMNHG